jgi:hypothetical protein
MAICHPLTCSRTAAATPLPCSVRTSSAASLSRASCTNRIVTARVSGGAPSSTTSPNAPLRSSTSALHAPRWGSGGRTTKRVLRRAQSRGTSVRVASMYAMRWSDCMTMWRTSEVLPLPSGPVISVSRPRGSPPASARSNAAIPVGNAADSAGAGGGAVTAARRCLRASSEAADTYQGHQCQTGLSSNCSLVVSVFFHGSSLGYLMPCAAHNRASTRRMPVR